MECKNDDSLRYELNENGVNVQYELIPIFRTTDERSEIVIDRLESIDNELDINEKRIEVIKSEIANNTSHADKTDYVVSGCCGVMAGLIDVFFVGKFDLKTAKTWRNKKVNEFVMDVAKRDGYQGDRLEGAIQFLENKHKVAHDSSFMGQGIGVSPRSHHLDDMAHHMSIVGWLFSLLTQFTGMAYYSNNAGEFKIVPVDEVTKATRIGKDFPEKICYGTVNWFFHLVSDMAGSNKTKGAGMGIPGPIMSLAKEISALPIVSETGLAKVLNDLYQGKLFKDEYGNPIKFDFRTELAIGHELGRQAIPVILNEVLVRTFYFIRRFVAEWKVKGDIHRINWRVVIPFKNATISRMMTIATGAFLVVDASDAAIKSGGTWAGFILRINFVNVFRFTLAIGDEFRYAWKREQLGEEYQKLLLERNALYGVKISYQQQGIWLVAKETNAIIQATLVEYCNYIPEFIERSNVIDERLKRIRSLLNK